MRFVNLRSIACPPHRTKRNEGAVKRQAETATIGGSRHFHARSDVCPRAFCTHACAAEAASAPMRGRENQHSIDATVPEILEQLHPRTEEIKTRIAHGEIREHLCSGCAGERSGARSRLATPRDPRLLR